jgi:hypothetical protein
VSPKIYSYPRRGLERPLNKVLASRSLIRVSRLTVAYRRHSEQVVARGSRTRSRVPSLASILYPSIYPAGVSPELSPVGSSSVSDFGGSSSSSFGLVGLSGSVETSSVSGSLTSSPSASSGLAGSLESVPVGVSPAPGVGVSPPVVSSGLVESSGSVPAGTSAVAGVPEDSLLSPGVCVLAGLLEGFPVACSGAGERVCTGIAV